MEKENGSLVEVAPVLRVFFPKILFKVDLAWMEDPGFPTGEGVFRALSHIQWESLKEGDVGLNLPLSKNVAFEFKLLTQFQVAATVKVLLSFSS